MKYYISDTHFGHERIISLANRPFANVQEMDAFIIQNWNNKVKRGDLVYHLGDFAWYSVDEYRRKLNGQIILVYGNHDWRRLQNNPKQWFVKVDNYLLVKDGEFKLVLCHYPIWSWHGMFKEWIHLYGHIHEKVLPSIENPKARCFNVSVEHINYTPVSIGELMEKRKEIL